MWGGGGREWAREGRYLSGKYLPYNCTWCVVNYCINVLFILEKTTITSSAINIMIDYLFSCIINDIHHSKTRGEKQFFKEDKRFVFMADETSSVLDISNQIVKTCFFYLCFYWFTFISDHRLWFSPFTKAKREEGLSKQRGILRQWTLLLFIEVDFFLVHSSVDLLA